MHEQTLDPIPETPPKRRWRRPRVRLVLAMLSLLLVAGVWWYRSEMRLIREIDRLGGDIGYGTLPLTLSQEVRKFFDRAYQPTNHGIVGVDLSDTSADDSAASLLSLHRGITRLRLRGTSIGDEGLLALQPLRQLQHLDLGKTRVTDNGLAVLRNFPQLAFLDLYVLPITDRGLEHLDGLSGLRSLNLAGTRITDDGLRHLSKLPTLADVMLRDTQIGDDGLAHLADLPLRNLDLIGTQITDAGLAHLVSSSTLQYLMVTGDCVTPGGLRRLTDTNPQLRIAVQEVGRWSEFPAKTARILRIETPETDFGEFLVTLDQGIRSRLQPGVTMHVIEPTGMKAVFKVRSSHANTSIAVLDSVLSVRPEPGWVLSTSEWDPDE